MPKEIKLAKYAGFCYGVKRAVETVKKLKAENPEQNVSVLGELIHNTDVIKELEALGIKTITEIPEKGEGICVVRSHGESPEVIERIKNAGFTPVDLTCPDVKKVQQTAVELAKNDYYVVIVGKYEHPEVIAIRANAELWSENVVVAASVEQLKEYEAQIKSHLDPQMDRPPGLLSLQSLSPVPLMQQHEINLHIIDSQSSSLSHPQKGNILY